MCVHADGGGCADRAREKPRLPRLLSLRERMERLSKKMQPLTLSESKRRRDMKASTDYVQLSETQPALEAADGDQTHISAVCARTCVRAHARARARVCVCFSL